MTAAAPDRIRISEIFGPTIQGEGALIGEPTVFVRTGGCDYRCSWCDSSETGPNCSPMTSCQVSTGSWLVTMVDLRP